MANGLFTPLQITASYGIETNTAFKIPNSVIASYGAYNSIPLISEINTAIDNVTHSAWASTTTKQNIQNITGTANACPALGSAQSASHSLVDYYNTRIYPGFAGYLRYIADLYIGGEASPDESIFCQGFMASSGYCSNVNKLLNSATNAQTYLGPTFPGNDALVTNNISNVNPDFGNFAKDLAAQGKLSNFANIELYGTPAGLLQQIANVAVINSNTLPVVAAQLLLAGLTTADIRVLINRPNSVSDSAFYQLQMLAYQGMTNVTGNDLQQVLDVLEVTTPNILTMADLLNQQKIFPNSFKTLQTPTADGFVTVYDSNGAVNMGLTPNIVAVTGCEELGKVMPPDQAVASKSVQAGLQQISGITASTPDELSMAIQTTDSAGNVLSGLSTMAGLPLIQNQSTVLNSTVSSYYAGKATGTGPNGTITISDVIGSLWGYNVTNLLNSVTSLLLTIPSGSTATLLDIYTRMVSVSNGTYGDPAVGPVTVPAGPGAGVYADGDAALAALITLANSEIASVASSYSAICSSANASFDIISQQLWMESQYQFAGAINFADYQPNSQLSIIAFVQNLPNYGTMTAPGAEAYYLNQVADTDTLGGQAIIGTMREGVNTQQLNAVGLGVDIKPSAEPRNPPLPVVTPVDEYSQFDDHP